jgi:hypothetical protein
MKTTVRNALILTASAVATAALLHATKAQAAGYIHHGVHACKPANSGTSFVFGNNQLYNPSTSAMSIYYCPITDSDVTPVQDLKELKAYVDDGSALSGSSGQVRAYGCIAYPFNTGGQCGSVANTGSGTTGWQSLSVPINGLTASLGDLPYLWIRLPAISAGLPSRMSGFTTKYWH